MHKQRTKAENKPIFIVGSGRSGTSVLTWCLGQHPNILPLPETHWITRLAVNMRQLYKIGTVHGRYSHLGALDWDEQDFFAEFGRNIDRFIVNTREPRLRFIRKLSAKNRELSDEQINELEQKGTLSPNPALVSAKNYQVVRANTDPKGRWVDGTPENSFYMYALATMFPNAKFIHILRDPNDVAKSLMSFSKAGGAGVDHGEAEAYATWQRFVAYAVKGEQALGNHKVLRISYEDLINNAEPTLRDCFDFLGEAFSADSLLPLQEKINSSSAGANKTENMIVTTQEGREANEFYQFILRARNSKPDANVLDELVIHFQNYADQINK